MTIYLSNDETRVTSTSQVHQIRQASCRHCALCKSTFFLSYLLVSFSVSSRLDKSTRSCEAGDTNDWCLQASNGQVSETPGGPPAGVQPAPGSGTAQAGLLVDVVGDSSTDNPAATRPAVQPVADIDAAGAIPEDNFTQYVITSWNFCC